MNAQANCPPAPTSQKKKKKSGKGKAKKGFPRPAASLALTRTQFTATSPLNLFDVNKGSTPGGVRVRGRELLGSANFGVTAVGFDPLTVGGIQFGFPLSPTSFPRIGNYKSIYEEYIFHRATIMFQSDKATTQSGVILMAADYDAADAVPANSVGMMRNISSTMANVYSDCSMECLGKLARLPRFFTNDTTSAQNTQARIYVAAEGVTFAASAAVGYILVDYDIEFFTPC